PIEPLKGIQPRPFGPKARPRTPAIILAGKNSFGMSFTFARSTIPITNSKDINPRYVNNVHALNSIYVTTLESYVYDSFIDTMYKFNTHKRGCKLSVYIYIPYYSLSLE